MATTRFLNVDLEIEGDDVGKLAEFLGASLCVLHSSDSFVTFELCDQPTSPDEAIDQLADAVLAMPHDLAKLWSSSRRRTFSIGVEAGAKPHCVEFPISPEALSKIVKLEANVTFAVYAATD